MFCVFCSVWCHLTFFSVVGFPGIYLVSEKSLIDSGHLSHPIAIKKSKSCASKRVRTRLMMQVQLGEQKSEGHKVFGSPWCLSAMGRPWTVAAQARGNEVSNAGASGHLL